MKNIVRIFAALAITLAVAACAGSKVDEFVSKAVTAISAPIDNPLGPVDIYRVKNVYGAALQVADDYRSYCWSKPYRVLIADPISKPVCENRRAVVRAMQRSAGTASRAIRAADTFIRNNPTGNAITYVNAAWDAVQAFRSSIPVVK